MSNKLRQPRIIFSVPAWWADFKAKLDCGQVWAKGDKGDMGDQGVPGIQGPQGISGEKGDQGDPGEIGSQGSQGVPGPTGAEGEGGPPGEQGPQGSAGPQGEQGTPGIQGSKGDNGDPGDQGPQGEQGLQGIKGDTGETGPQGSPGSKGDKGDTGDAGPQGLPGADGEDGAPGPKGYTGDTGLQGVPGEQGIQGSPGPRGYTGDDGAQGEQGIQGIPGEPGAKGDKGDKGDTGNQGIQGPAGPSVNDISSFRKTGTGTYEAWFTSPKAGTALAGSALTANRLYAMPFIVPKNITVDQIGVYVSTLSTTTARLGIYSDNGNCYPGNLLLDAGTIDVTATGAKKITINQVLAGGTLYWLVIVCAATPAIYCIPVAGIINILGHSNALGTAQNAGLYASLTYGALPSTFPGSPTLITAAPIPAIFVRLSA